MKKELYRNLKKKIVIVTLLISTAPLLILGVVIYYQFAKVCEARLKDQIGHLARTQGNSLEVFLKERANILSAIVNAYSFEDLAKQETLFEFFDRLKTRSEDLGLVDLGVIDDTGQQLAYVGPYKLTGLNYYQEAWFNEVISKGRYISDVYMGFRNVPHFIIAIRGHRGRRDWVLRATIDSDVFNRLVTTFQAGKSGDAFIVNSGGYYQTQPRFHGVILGKSGLDPNLFSRGSTAVERISIQGEEKYYAGKWLKNSQWLLVISQETCDEMQRLVEARNTEMLLLFVGCMAIFVATIFITQTMVKHLERADEETDRLNVQLMHSDKLAALGKMAAGIAHEINNPLQVIGEKAGWMKDLLEEEDLRQSDNFKEYSVSIDRIEYHVDRARKVTHNLLGFARRMEPRQDDVDVNDVLKQTIDLLENHARINNIGIQTDLQEDLPIIASDQSQLQQVFLNLLNNAVDAIGSEGQIEVASRLEDSNILIRISDNGPGIPAAVQNRIFDPFYTTKVSGKGTGLGLSICYSILEKIGATLTFKSKEFEGTTFHITIPVVRPEKK